MFIARKWRKIIQYDYLFCRFVFKPVLPWQRRCVQWQNQSGSCSYGNNLTFCETRAACYCVQGLTDWLISDVFYLYTNCVHTYQPFQVVYCYARCVLLTKSVNRSSPQSASLLFSMLFIRIFNPVFFVCFLLQLYILTLYMLHDNIANFCTLLMF